MKDKPRVRFAPSPTGDLHVGNARTALFNWLFARHYKGSLILRIEDTDRTRTSTEYEKRIIGDLQWLSIDWDEGPEKGGDYGPYHQSKRLDLYKEYLSRLISERKAYPCYCTEEELEAERTSLLSRGLMPRYMGKCRKLSLEDRKRLEARGRRPAYRFKIEEAQIVFNDLIRGPMKFESGAIGDFIIVRSNGIPAYNFAVVIDDHHMKISHVIRGEDHLSNTAVQILLYRAFNFEPPLFAHHSLILGKDRAKLSKRHGSVAVADFRRMGILPEALLNYLSLLGSSFAEGKEIFDRGELIENFSLERAGRSGAIFDEDKLKWMNSVYIRKYGIDALTRLLTPYMRESGLDTETLDYEWLKGVVGTVRGNLVTLSDIRKYMGIFFDDKYELSEEAVALLREADSRNVVRAFHEAMLSECSGEDDLYKCAIKKVQARYGMQGKKLFMPLRAAITGSLLGPELDRVVEMLGRDSVLNRIRKAMQITAAPG
ncbi:MAG: glutamate--tRNA ligase [Syntrophales bacterium]